LGHRCRGRRGRRGRRGGGEQELISPPVNGLDAHVSHTWRGSRSSKHWE
jgi:hypothetical protein